AAVMRLLGQKYRLVEPLARERAIRIAGDCQVVSLPEEALRQFHRGDALRAVAGAREGDEQRRDLLAEVEMRRGNQIRRGDRLDAAAQLRTEVRRKAFADECGGTGSSQYDAQACVFAQRAKKSLQRLPARG